MTSPGSLEFVAVSKAFDPAKPVLTGLSVSIDLSQVTYVLGRSGAGKSVLCRLAVGLTRPDAGRITLDGTDVGSASDRELIRLRKRFPYLVQEPALLDWLSVEENVELAAPAGSQGTAIDALRRVGLESVRDRPPERLGRGVQKLASVARALVLGPRYLIFDEPTTGMDAGAARKVNRVLQSLKEEGLGAMVVSHDYRGLKALADRVVIVAAGGAVFAGTVAEFMSSDLPEVAELRNPAREELADA